MNYDKIITIVISIILVILLVYTAFFLKEEEDEFEVVIYFSDSQAMNLISEKRIIANDNNLYIKTIKELIKGPKKDELNKTLPEETEILEINIENGVCYANFNQTLQTGHWGGSTGERMTVYSIVNSLTQFEDIEKVQILIAGEEIETLAGHMDLAYPLERDESLIGDD